MSQRETFHPTAGLHAVAVALAGALVPAEVAEGMVREGGRAVGADAGAVALLRPEPAELELIAASGFPEGFAQGHSALRLDAPTPMADALRQGEPILLESGADLAERYPQLAASDDWMRQYAWALVPLSLPDRQIGVFVLGFQQPRSFAPEGRSLLSILAQIGAQALERARLYEAEREARVQAEAAVRARDAFFSIAAHELKTPLTSLLGQAQLLQRRMVREGLAEERFLQSIDVVVSQAMRLNAMVSALLDFTRIEQGRLSLQRAPLDMTELVQRVVAEIQLTLSSHTLVFDPASGAERLMIDGDELRLEQVVQNLIGNAIRYSPGGGTVLVRVERRPPWASLQVVDRGIGVPADDLPHLFTRFFRASNASLAHMSGLGIGLYVVKEIVGLHGGSVSVESTEGEGSSFSVLLPLRDEAGGI